MSNISLKEQLQAVASKLSDTLIIEQKSTVTAPNNMQHNNRSSQPSHQASNLPQRGQPTKSHKPQHSHEIKLKKPKPRWLEYVQYGIELLKIYFPASFKPSNEVKPLKKGIKQDLVTRLSTLEHIVTEDKACMVKSLSYYVNTMSYHKSVLEGAIRIDIDGMPAGTVTGEEAKYSVEKQQTKSRHKSSSALAATKTSTAIDTKPEHLPDSSESELKENQT